MHCNHGDAFQFEYRNSKNLTKCNSIFIVITFANLIEDFIVTLHRLLKDTLNNVFTNHIIKLHNELSIA